MIHISRERDSAQADETLAGFLREHAINILNVAGPRASKEPEVGRFVKDVLEKALIGNPTSAAM